MARGTFGQPGEAVASLLLLLVVIGFSGGFSMLLHPTEVNILKDIEKKMGKTNWNFEIDPCSGAGNWISKKNNIVRSNISCVCQEDATCYITEITLTGQNFSGAIPSEFSNLGHLKKLDLSRNCFTGSIPSSWAATSLVEITLAGNNLSGPFPLVLTKIYTLEVLHLEANKFSGPIPSEIGRLKNLKRLIISSNRFEGKFPLQLFNLINLTVLRLSDTGFTGQIPNMFHKLENIHTLYVQGTSLEGPIPSSLSFLSLTDLRISDLKGTKSTTIPDLSTSKSIKNLILRSCMIQGSIPKYFADMTSLQVLDLSFNSLTGEIPEIFSQLKVGYLYLTANKLTGRIPEWIRMKTKMNIDISKNNFTYNDSDVFTCLQGNVNLVESYSSSSNNMSQVDNCMKRNLPCASTPQYHPLHINCGGKSVLEKESTYDTDVEARGASMYYSSQSWAFTNTGNFMDDGEEDDAYVQVNSSALVMTNSFPESLYTNARASAMSLTYYGLCLINGNYLVKLHFAEIVLTSDDKTFTSLGQRIFDVYIQGELVLKDFNIAKEAGGASTPIVKTFNVNVTTSWIEIRFYWAGKGTQMIPYRGNYGPLISAISVIPNFKPHHSQKDNLPLKIALSTVASAIVLLVVVMLVYCKLKAVTREGLINALLYTCASKASAPDSFSSELALYPNLKVFGLRQLNVATRNFHADNRLGLGGFGSVYKGILLNGTNIAVKRLAPNSRQGSKEFWTELETIATLIHPNIIKLLGCCREKTQMILVYEFMENNSLYEALFGEDKISMPWETRKKIFLGIAEGLAFLHEQCGTKIVHRDLKPNNVLLDPEMNPKIGDFGLAKLIENNETHLSTKASGTVGYMSLEYVKRGILTEKADVYGYGVILIELVTRLSVISYNPSPELSTCLTLVDVVHFYTSNCKERLKNLIDPELELSAKEAIGILQVAVQCTDPNPRSRPKMSEVLSQLEAISEESNSRINRTSSGPSTIVGEITELEG